MHVVVFYAQIRCFLLRIGREHDVVENDLIDKLLARLIVAAESYLGLLVAV